MGVVLRAVPPVRPHHDFVIDLRTDATSMSALAARPTFWAKMAGADARFVERTLHVTPEQVRAALAATASNGQARETLHGGVLSVKEIGTRLFTSLFEGEIGAQREDARQHAIRERAGHQVVLRFDDQASPLIALPWELMLDTRRGEFLELLGDGVARTFSTARQDAPARRRAERPVVLVVSVQLDGSFAIEREVEAIEKALSATDVVVRHLANPTVADLADALSEVRPDILHHIGTGWRGENEGHIDTLLMAVTSRQPNTSTDDTQLASAGLTARKLGDLLDALPSETRPSIVVLNACESDAFAAKIAGSAPFVMGWAGYTTDNSCIAFSAAFYASLAQGASTDAAVSRARMAVMTEDAESAIAVQRPSWSAPVVYGSAGPLGRITRPEAAAVARVDLESARVSLDGGREARADALRRLMLQQNEALLAATPDPHAVGQEVAASDQLVEVREAIAQLRGPSPAPRASVSSADALHERTPMKVLGGLWSTLGERRRLLASVGALLDAIEPSARIVAGERDRWDASKTLLESAGRDLERLDEENAAAVAAQVAAALDHEEWEVLEEIHAALQRVHEAQTKTVEALRTASEKLGRKLGDVRRTLDMARRTLTPIFDLERTYEGVETLHRRAERDLVRGSMAILRHQAPLKGAPQRLDEIDATLRERMADAQLRYRHAELVLLQARSEAGIHDYTVLFRTPAESGTVGIHVQGSSSVVEQDRGGILETLGVLDEALEGTDVRRSEGVTSRTLDATSETEEAPDASLPERRRGFTGSPGASSQEDLDGLVHDVGDLTFRLFLPNELQQYLRSTPCALTLTTNDLEMPWELMTTDGKVLCLDRCVGRMPMGATFPSALPPPHKNEAFKFLLICADDQGRLRGAMREFDRIHKALVNQQQEEATSTGTSRARAIRRPIQVHTLRSPNVTIKELTRLIRKEKFNVIHFAGHARFDAKDSDKSALILDDGIFLAQKFRRLLTGRPLVFLNACNTTQTRNEDSARHANALHAPAEGLAASFLYAGAVACLGSTWPVHDAPASHFAIVFYQLVLEGYVIGEAVRRARNAVKEKYPDHITWATFVLYGNPTFPLEA